MKHTQEDAVLALFTAAMLTQNTQLIEQVCSEHLHTLSTVWQERVKLATAGLQAMDTILAHTVALAQAMHSEQEHSIAHTAEQATDALLAKMRLH